MGVVQYNGEIPGMNVGTLCKAMTTGPGDPYQRFCKLVIGVSKFLYIFNLCNKITSPTQSKIKSLMFGWNPFINQIIREHDRLNQLSTAKSL